MVFVYTCSLECIYKHRCLLEWNASKYEICEALRASFIPLLYLIIIKKKKFFINYIMAENLTKKNNFGWDQFCDFAPIACIRFLTTNTSITIKLLFYLFKYLKKI